MLDGGESEVFLGGTRLKQFMDSVDKATTGIPKAMPDSSVEERARAPEGRADGPGAPPAPALPPAAA